MRSQGLLFAMLLTGCDGGGAACDPASPVACSDSERCVVRDGEGRCETVASCDPADPSTCPGGFVCRPSGDGAICEPELTVGRIPGCVDSAGMDLFAVESFEALSVTWNVNGDVDFEGGFRVRWGTASMANDLGMLEVGPSAREAVITGLTNGTAYYVVVDALGSGGGASFTSCEVMATPHALAFVTELEVDGTAAAAQARPDIASNLEGDRLYLAWEEEGAIALAISEDFGGTWRALSLVGASGAGPALAVVEEVVDPETDEVLEPETVLLAWEDAGNILLARYFPEEDRFEDGVILGAGTLPDVAVGPEAVHVVYLDGGTVFHAGSNDAGVTFLEPIAVSTGTTAAGRPTVEVDQFIGDVYAGWHAMMGRGDFDVFVATSLDMGATFGAAVRIDDDPGGGNQENVSLAIDERSGRLVATWEDRRVGSDVYFSSSSDQGASWETNVNVGAGLGGDQFRPRAVIDIARNVYVVFQDTTNGARVVFSRFNAQGSFDPPLAPSSQAGMAGVVGDHPTVAADRYGTVYVAWEENREGPTPRIFFNRAE
jgi:hypothetical protein